MTNWDDLDDQINDELVQGLINLKDDLRGYVSACDNNSEKLAYAYNTAFDLMADALMQQPVEFKTKLALFFAKAGAL